MRSVLNHSFRMIRNMFSAGYPVYRDGVELSCEPFFVIGSGRSGNTLLRAILCSHPDVSVPPESYVLANMVRKYSRYDYLPWSELVKIVIGELESHQQFYTWEIDMSPVYQRVNGLREEDRTLSKIIDEIYSYYGDKRFPGWKIWGDKTPINTLRLKWIDPVFPGARYIHIIRDGRDVVRSYLKMGRYEKMDQAAMRWKESVEAALEFGRKKGEYYMELRYEDLVSEPERETKRVCRFLDIDFKKEILDHRTRADNLGDVDKLEHHKNVTSPINTKSMGKWRDYFSAEEKKELESLLKDNLERLGYGP